jgi:hypothetical protein
VLKASLRRLDRQGGKRKDVEKAPTLQNFPSKGSFVVESYCDIAPSTLSSLVLSIGKFAESHSDDLTSFFGDDHQG